MCVNPLKNALWIGADKNSVSPVFLRRFLYENCTKAELIITSCGFFETKINGQNVTDNLFLPVVTDYEKRDMSKWIYPIFDTLTHRLYYYTFDITSLLNKGENTLSVHLGNGWYMQDERVAEGNMSFGEQLKTAYCIRLYTDNGIVDLLSDGTEMYYDSEITYSSLFIGEVIDPVSVTFEERQVTVCTAPETELCEALGTPDKVIRTLCPELLGEKNGKKIYDIGENTSGLVRVTAKNNKGDKITIRFSEELDEDGNLSFHSCGGGYTCTSGRKQIQEDTFICTGETYIFCPKFLWHAFRYFEIEGNFENLEMLVIHAATAVTSTFECSSEGLNFLYEAYIRSQLTNMHGSIPSDCPHRERLGYTGDGQVCAPAGMLLLDSREFYRKWMQDILDCQCKISGHVQHTAPMMGGGGGPGGWGCAIVFVPWAFYKQFGEVQMLEKTYEPMRRWVQYLLSKCENGLIVREENGGWCLGDWCTREKITLPEPFVNTCFFIKILRILCEIAEIIGKAEDIGAYEKLIADLEKAVVENYKDKGGTSFCNGVQGADAYAVWAGLSDKAKLSGIAAKYDTMRYFDTGFIATDILSGLLADNGYIDTFFNIIDNDDLGTYLYMKRQGATTVWENWNGESSHNHPMFGAPARYLFTGILGIRQAENSVAYNDLLIAPQVPSKLDFANGSLVLPCGKVSVSFKKEENSVRFEITLPENKEADFIFGDYKTILHSGVNVFDI
ncbi:MAG: family 78 glycoside hydrolase catalytic domain [Clostridia bacterium]|nr:family 78 glycoside hydrolase catalytic domain [Clostridia bacterium]